MPKASNKFVFINCPFDDSYRPLLQAIAFAVRSCGYYPRCALEEIDSGEARLDKIFRLIDLCQLGIPLGDTQNRPIETAGH